MDKIPNTEEINAATAFITACTVVLGLIVRAIEKARDKRKLKRDIRNGKESIYEPYEDER